MKKTLALLLALLMIASMMLVSCGDQTPKETEPNDFDGPSTEDELDGTDEGDEDEDLDSTDNETGSISSSTFQPASGTVYFLYSVKVRENPKSAKKNYVGNIYFGDSAELIETNNTWSKVRFDANGVKVEGYVYNDVYTMNADAITLEMYPEAKDAKIANLGNRNDENKTPYTLNVRTTPWDCGNSVFDSDSEYLNVNVLSGITGGLYSITDGKEIKVLGTTKDGAWCYIQYTVTVKTEDGDTTKTEKGYCSKRFVVIPGEATPDSTDTTVPNTETKPLPV